MSALHARADDSNIYVDWKFGNRNQFSFKTGYVWNGAWKNAVVAAMEAGDYAAFGALTNGFNEKAEIQGKWTRYKTGATCAPVKIGSFTNAQDFITFLYFDPDWEATNSPVYYILEQSVGNKRYGPQQQEQDRNQVNAGEYKDFFTAGTVGAALTNGAALLIATDPVNLPWPGFSPVGMTNGLAAGASVVCAAPETIVFRDVHYSRRGVSLETWNGAAWGAPEEKDASNGAYTYTHGSVSARLTWKYAADGFRLDAGPARPNTGAVVFNRKPDFDGLAGEEYYTKDSEVTLTAVPVSDGFGFRGWLEGTNALDASPAYTVKMDQPRTVRAVFESIPLYWAGNDGNVWTNGGAGWLATNGTPAVWLNGSTAVFTNGVPVVAEIAAAGVTATAVRVEGAAVELTGEMLTMINDARLSAPGDAGFTINAALAGTDGLTVFANDAEKSLVIGMPTVFTGDLAIEAGRLDFGEEGKLGEDGTFAGTVTLARGAVLATPPCVQTFSGSISGEGRVLVWNSESAVRAEASFTGGAGWTGGLTVGTNGFVEEVYNKSRRIPESGMIEAVDGGEIKLSEQGPNVTTPFYIRNGGVLTLNQKYALRGNFRYDGRPVFLENGRVHLDKSCLIYSLDVTNGGTVDGEPSEMNDGWRNQTVTVRGNAPLIHQAGYAWDPGQHFATLTMDVKDADGSMNVSGPVTGDAGGKTLIKTGAGTVVFSGENTYSNCITRIDEGTLRFDTAGAMGIGTDTDTRIVLNGEGAEGKSCVLDIGTNANAVCALGLERKGGTLKLGEGGSVSFADSSLLGWADDAELDIVGKLGLKTVRFGTDEHGLTDVQLCQVRLNGESKPFRLNPNGWLCGDPAGTAIILR